MKQVTIIGNLGANAVMRTASDGKQLMSFNVAVNSGANTTTWFNCIGNMRDKLFQYLVKGQCVLVQGDLNARVYNGSIDLSISVDKIELCGKAPETKSETPDVPSQQPAQPTADSQQVIMDQNAADAVI